MHQKEPEKTDMPYLLHIGCASSLGYLRNFLYIVSIFLVFVAFGELKRLFENVL
jgi:hypothetical protein